MPIKKTVYDKETGQTHEMWSLDAHEAVQNDPRRYSLGKPQGWNGKPLIKAPKAAPKAGAPASETALKEGEPAIEE